MNQQNPNTPRKIPLRSALGWILLNTICISGTAFLGWYYFQHDRQGRLHDPKFDLVAIVQTGPEKEVLKTEYLAELLDLSIDRPTNLYRFSTQEARSKLLASPLIKEAEVKKIAPGTVYIDYAIRKPVAFLSDYTNTALDAEGNLFPVKPFFTPKRLPEIYLGFDQDESISEEWKGEGATPWGRQLKQSKAVLALSLLTLISKHCCSEKSHLRRIDVSRAFASAYGKRQIVIVMEDLISESEPAFSYYTRIMRLSTENFRQDLANYLVLHERFINNVPEHKIIDLRLSSLAFLSSE